MRELPQAMRCSRLPFEDAIFARKRSFSGENCGLGQALPRAQAIVLVASTNVGILVKSAFCTGLNKLNISEYLKGKRRANDRHIDRATAAQLFSIKDNVHTRGHTDIIAELKVEKSFNLIGCAVTRVKGSSACTYTR